MSLFKIRRATVQDRHLIGRLAAGVWFSTYADLHSPLQLEYMFERMYDPESIRRQMADGHWYFIAYLDEVAVGYMDLEHKREDLFYLHKLYVLPEYQANGMGRKMFLFAASYIKHLHPASCMLELNVNRKNKAVCFYERMGMEKFRESEEEIGNGFIMNNTYMRMNL